MIRGMFTPDTPAALQQKILAMMLKAPEATAAGAMLRSSIRSCGRPTSRRCRRSPSGRDKSAAAERRGDEEGPATLLADPGGRDRPLRHDGEAGRVQPAPHIVRRCAGAVAGAATYTGRSPEGEAPMATGLRVLCAAAFVLAAFPGGVSAQWLNYPTPGVPRTADGKPNLSAPAPRTADGKPDLSGMWGWDTRANCGAHCNDLQFAREFMNIAASLKGPPAVSARRGGSGQETNGGAGPGSQCALHAARSCRDLDRRLLQADLPVPGPRRSS